MTYCESLCVEIEVLRAIGKTATWALRVTLDLTVDWHHRMCSKATECGFGSTIHGDDAIMLGTDLDIDWFEKDIKERFEVRIRGRLGPGPENLKAIIILIRISEWDNEGIWCEADQRHVDICQGARTGPA